MPYFNIILSLYFLLISPVKAYRSANTSIIHTNQKQSLLDRKYIFDNINLQQQAITIKETKVNLNSLSQLNKNLKPHLKVEPSKKVSFKSKLINKPRKAKTEFTKRSIPKLKFEDTWNSFQAVNDEELRVKAKIIGIVNH